MVKTFAFVADHRLEPLGGQPWLSEVGQRKGLRATLGRLAGRSEQRAQNLEGLLLALALRRSLVFPRPERVLVEGPNQNCLGVDVARLQAATLGKSGGPSQLLREAQLAPRGLHGYGLRVPQGPEWSAADLLRALAALEPWLGAASVGSPPWSGCPRGAAALQRLLEGAGSPEELAQELAGFYVAARERGLLTVGDEQARQRMQAHGLELRDWLQARGGLAEGGRARPGGG